MDSNVTEDILEPVHNLARPVALAVDPRNNDIYFSDVHTLQIARRNVQGANDPVVVLGKGESWNFGS